MESIERKPSSIVGYEESQGYIFLINDLNLLAGISALLDSDTPGKVINLETAIIEGNFLAKRGADGRVAHFPIEDIRNLRQDLNTISSGQVSIEWHIRLTGRNPRSLSDRSFSLEH